MKKIVLIGVFALLAACGSSNSGVSVGTDGDDTGGAAAPASDSGTDETSGGSDDTISVENLGDVPPECLSLLGDFLKAIEPMVSDVDWGNATLADMEALGQEFQAQSDEFDSESAAAGCDQYDITGSDDKTFEQVIALAEIEAPGTVEWLNFIYNFGESVDDSSTPGSMPAGCQETIAAIEVYLNSGKTMQELTIDELTKVGSLMTAVSTNCSADEAAAFYAREDVLDFIGG